MSCKRDCIFFLLVRMAIFCNNTNKNQINNFFFFCWYFVAKLLSFRGWRSISANNLNATVLSPTMRFYRLFSRNISGARSFNHAINKYFTLHIIFVVTANLDETTTVIITLRIQRTFVALVTKFTSLLLKSVMHAVQNASGQRHRPQNGIKWSISLLCFL